MLGIKISGSHARQCSISALTPPHSKSQSKFWISHGLRMKIHSSLNYSCAHTGGSNYTQWATHTHYTRRQEPVLLGRRKASVGKEWGAGGRGGWKLFRFITAIYGSVKELKKKKKPRSQIVKSKLDLKICKKTRCSNISSSPQLKHRRVPRSPGGWGRTSTVKGSELTKTFRLFWGLLPPCLSYFSVAVRDTMANGSRYLGFYDSRGCIWWERNDKRRQTLGGSWKLRAGAHIFSN